MKDLKDWAAVHRVYKQTKLFIVKYKCRKLQTKNVGRCNYIL